MDSSVIQQIAVYILPVLFAITLHEAAHGYVANRFGDSTARVLGRVTLNPVKHVDPIGTIVVPALTFLSGGFLFGWAKPVPVVAGNMRNPVRDMGLVAAAGPGANLLMAFLWAVLFKFMLIVGLHSKFVFLMAIAGIKVNLVLGALNLLPIPPLDGGRILTSLLPPNLAEPFSRIEPYGFLILIGLLVTNMLGTLIRPLMNAGYALISTIVGI